MSKTLFDVLAKIDEKDRDWLFSGEYVEDEKQVIPLLTERWLSSAKDEQTVVILNEFVNPYIFRLYQHKRLLTALLMTATTGRRQRYSYPKQPKTQPHTLAIQLICKQYRVSKEQAEDILRMYNVDSIQHLAELHGWQKDEIKKLRDEFKPA
jgi:hypothetical protein